MKIYRKDYLILLFLIVILLILGLLIGRKYWFEDRPASPVTVVEEEPRHFREVRLYFGERDAMYLSAETRVLDNCPDDQACLQQTVQALVDGPVGDLVPIMPSKTQVRSVNEQGGLASIDFSRELVNGHPGGSVSELFTIYGLANTLAENFPYIRQIRILIEGQTVESLKGHVDLTGPISADFRYVRRQSAQNRAEAASAVDRSQLSLAAEEERFSPPSEVPPPEEAMDGDEGFEESTAFPEEGLEYYD